MDQIGAWFTEPGRYIAPQCIYLFITGSFKQHLVVGTTMIIELCTNLFHLVKFSQMKDRMKKSASYKIVA